MGSDQNGGTTKVRTKSQFAQNRGQENRQSHADIGGHHGNQAVEDGQNAWLQHRVDASPSRLSLSSSLNQRTPARSYFQHPYRESIHGTLRTPISICEVWEVAYISQVLWTFRAALLRAYVRILPSSLRWRCLIFPSITARTLPHHVTSPLHHFEKAVSSRESRRGMIGQLVKRRATLRDLILSRRTRNQHPPIVPPLPKTRGANLLSRKS